MKFLALLALGAILGACATAPRPPAAPLPYHVAFEPIARVQAEETAGARNMRLFLGDEELSYLNERLLAQLGPQNFTRVTAIAPRAEATGPLDPELLSIRTARETTQADLLVTFELRYGTAIYHEVSEFRVSIPPWWILPGPWLWWSPDHAYSADMTLTVKLFDLARSTQGEADRPLELRRWFFSHAISLDQVFLNFVERAGGRWELYLLSMIAPSTALALSHRQLEIDLRRRFIDSLTAALAFELQHKQTLLIRNERDYSFYLEPSQLEVVRSSARQARVRFSLDLKVGRSRNEPAALRLFPDDAESVPDLVRLTQSELIAASEHSSSRPGYARYSFERSVEVGPRTRALRLHVAAGGAHLAVREFTLALPEVVALED